MPSLPNRLHQPGALSWLRNWFKQWQQRRHEETILKQCGNVCYCSCGATLNDQTCEAIGSGIYQYKCRCGAISFFDLISYPMPTKMGKDDLIRVLRKPRYSGNSSSKRRPPQAS